MPLILGTNSIKDTGYDVANSLRFNSGDSPSLSRTSGGSPSSTTKGTFSFWLKRSKLGINDRFVTTNSLSDPYFQMYFDSNASRLDQIRLQCYNGSAGSVLELITNQKFRDNSAWYNIILSYDSTPSTPSSSSIKLFVNGTQVTSFATATYPSQNQNHYFNQGLMRLSGYGASSSDHTDGYMAEVVYCDGQALNADSFGEFDEDSGIWKPIDVSGLTFGTNGFYLDFEDSSALGNDAAGSNNFTVNNLTAVDQSTDTCTNNFATLNPLTIGATAATLGEGNTSIVGGANNAEWYTASTIAPSTGKWYVEIRNDFASGQAADLIVGFTTNLIDVKNEAFPGKKPHSLGLWSAGTDVGDIKINNSVVSNQYTGDWGSANKILGMALDLDNKIVYFSIDGVFQSSGNPSAGSGGYDFSSSLTPFEDNYFIAIGSFTNSSNINQCSINFGSPSFAISSGNSDANGYGNFEYAVPSGYYALNTKNLAEFG